VNIDKIIPGSMSGTISPAGSASMVTATSGYRTFTAVPDANGNFKIEGPTYGTYYVTVMPTAGSGMFAPYRKTIPVNNGQHLTIGNIGLTSTAPPYPVACKIDGVIYNTQSGAILTTHRAGLESIPL
jgi:hypothetical protein